MDLSGAFLHQPLREAVEAGLARLRDDPERREGRHRAGGEHARRRSWSDGARRVRAHSPRGTGSGPG